MLHGPGSVTQAGPTSKGGGNEATSDALSGQELGGGDFTEHPNKHEYCTRLIVRMSDTVHMVQIICELRRRQLNSWPRPHSQETSPWLASCSEGQEEEKRWCCGAAAAREFFSMSPTPSRAEPPAFEAGRRAAPPRTGPDPGVPCSRWEIFSEEVGACGQVSESKGPGPANATRELKADVLNALHSRAGPGRILLLGRHSHTVKCPVYSFRYERPVLPLKGSRTQQVTVSHRSHWNVPSWYLERSSRFCFSTCGLGHILATTETAKPRRRPQAQRKRCPFHETVRQVRLEPCLAGRRAPQTRRILCVHALLAPQGIHRRIASSKAHGVCGRSSPTGWSSSLQCERPLCQGFLVRGSGYKGKSGPYGRKAGAAGLRSLLCRG